MCSICPTTSPIVFAVPRPRRESEGRIDKRGAVIGPTQTGRSHSRRTSKIRKKTSWRPISGEVHSKRMRELKGDGGGRWRSHAQSHSTRTRLLCPDSMRLFGRHHLQGERECGKEKLGALRLRGWRALQTTDGGEG
jgi:hypothetical protein